jgi:hypothetical protein
MSDEPTPASAPAPVPSVASTSLISLGMACSVMSIPVLLNSAHDIFHWMPRVREVWKSVNVRNELTTDLFSRYGYILWLMVAVSIVLSVILAFRRPGKRRTVAMQVATFVAAVILAYMAPCLLEYYGQPVPGGRIGAMSHEQ